MGLLELSQRQEVIKIAKGLMKNGLNPLEAVQMAEKEIEESKGENENV